MHIDMKCFIFRLCTSIKIKIAIWEKVIRVVRINNKGYMFIYLLFSNQLISFIYHYITFVSCLPMVSHKVPHSLSMIHDFPTKTLNRKETLDHSMDVWLVSSWRLYHLWLRKEKHKQTLVTTKQALFKVRVMEHHKVAMETMDSCHAFVWMSLEQVCLRTST